MPEAVSQRIIEIAGGLMTYVLNGAVHTVTIMKDITAEEFFASVNGIFSSTAGHALHIDRYIQHLIQPNIISNDGDLLLNTVIKYLGPRIDLWRFLLKHKYLLLHILYLSRYLCLLQPTVLVIWSAPVMQMLVDDLFTTVWTSLSEDELVKFMSGESGEYLLPLINSHKPIPASQGEDHVNRQCQIFIVSFGYHNSHLSLAISLRHPGHIKYNPVLEQLGLQLYHLGQGVIKVVEGVAAQMQKEHPIPSLDRDKRLTWLQTCKQRSEVIIEESGLKGAIRNTKADIRLRVKFIYFLTLINTNINQ